MKKNKIANFNNSYLFFVICMLQCNQYIPYYNKLYCGGKL